MKPHWIIVLLSAALAGSAKADEGIYIEFLWSRPAPDAIARQQTRQFVTEGGHDHQVCVAANATETDVGGLWIELADARGETVSRQRRPRSASIRASRRRRITSSVAFPTWPAAPITTPPSRRRNGAGGWSGRWTSIRRAA